MNSSTADAAQDALDAAGANRHAELAGSQPTAALLRDVLETLPAGITVYDQNDRFVLCNQTYADMFPIAARLAREGRTLDEVVRLAAAAGQYPDAGETPAERAAWAEACLAEHRTPGVSAWIVTLPDGRVVQPRQVRSASGNLVCVRSDTTDLVRAQAALRAQAEQDPLTRIANRTALPRAIEQALHGQRAGSDGTGIVMLLDIDNFKQVNDRYGHDAGDRLLVEVAQRLRANIRPGDLAARLGGDEFAVLMPGLSGERAVRLRLDALHAVLSAPAQIGRRRINVSVSAGVALLPRDGTSAEQLLKHADLALYEAKREGRGRWRRFELDLTRADARHAHLSEALHAAIENGDMAVALQPKRRLGGAHDGFEALARWRDGDRFVPPSVFVPVAEEAGLCGALGRMVADAALARIAGLRQLGLATGSVAINVSGAELLDSQFLPDMLERLRRYDLREADLELEITETVLLGATADRIGQVLHDVGATGITVALDDFGTGCASLPHLAQFPIDRLKIDRSFVAQIAAGGRGLVITRTVIGLARGLGMQSVAEGVETSEQLAFLQAEGCDAAQGYLIARPMLTLDEAAAYLRRSAAE